MSRDALEQNQIPIYFVAVIAAAIGGLIAPAATQSLNALVTPTIAVLMYAMFLQIESPRLLWRPFRLSQAAMA
jgi:ACR3 family arsenite efflux pump ArsB